MSPTKVFIVYNTEELWQVYILRYTDFGVETVSCLIQIMEKHSEVNIFKLKGY